MNKKDIKLRDALGKLFKARGDTSKTNSKGLKQTKKMKDLNKQKANGKPKISETTNGKDTSNVSNLNTEENVQQPVKMKITQKSTVKKKFNKKNSANLSKNKTKTQPATKENTSKYPRGYFVRNHTAEDSEFNSKKKSKAAVEEHEKVLNTNKKSKTLKNNKKPAPMIATKRKANMINGPQSKIIKNKNGKFDSEPTSEDNTSNSDDSFNKYFPSNECSNRCDKSSNTDETDTTDDDFNYATDDGVLNDPLCDSCSLSSIDGPFKVFDPADNGDDTYDDFSGESISSAISMFHSVSWSSLEDRDCELSKTVIEDHIVHQGLAVKHDLGAELDIQFDKHNDNAQIVELPTPLNEVKQHESFSTDHLRTLEKSFVEEKTISRKGPTAAIKSYNNEPSDVDECPELVPIDDVNFKLWTSGIAMDDEIFSEASEYIADSDDVSVTAAEGNINDKYLNSEDEYDNNYGSYSEDELEDITELATQKQQSVFNIKADVIVSKQKYLSDFRRKAPMQSVKRQISLSKIMEQTKDLIDSSKVIIKTAVVNDATLITNGELSQKTILEEPAVMRSSELNSTEMEDSGKSSLFAMIDNSAAIYDSTDSLETTPIVDEESIGNTHAEFKDLSENLQVNKFKTTFFESIDSHKVLVLLKSPFYIYGTIKVILIAGAAEIFGYKLEKLQTHELYSPRGVCALQISPFTKSTSVSESPKNIRAEILASLSLLRNECEFLPYHLDKLLDNFEQSTDAILLLEKNDYAQNMKRMLKMHVKENIFPPQIPLSRPFYASEYLLDCMINVNTEYPLIIPSQLHELRMECNSKFLLVGGKSVGKSTLLRFMVNKHLNKFPAVLVIDLDIGQPEIFASQAVSCALVQQPLLGPGFFYGIQPKKAFCVAHSNIVLCAHRYLPAVVKLLQYCNEELSFGHIPWIVNTMGYNKGFGAELIAVIAEHLRPTDIVQIQSNKAINNFDYLFEPHVVPSIERNIFNRPQYAPTNTTALNHRLHVVNSAVLQQGRYQSKWQMSAQDMRYVMLLTQLSRILSANSEILNQKHTYFVNMDELKITNPLSNQSAPMEVAKSLVSNLVYLGRSETNSTELETIECYGIGIVRAIDWPARQIYLLTALSWDRLKNVNTLTAGNMPLPASMLILQNLTTNVGVPFVQNVANEASSRAVKQFYSRTK